jgi:hypothetical protein
MNFGNILKQLFANIWMKSTAYNFRSPRMKTLDWSVETLGREYTSPGSSVFNYKRE